METFYRVTFVKRDGTEHYSAYNTRPLAEAGIERRKKGGLYESAVLFEVQRDDPNSFVEREQIVYRHDFD